MVSKTGRKAAPQHAPKSCCLLGLPDDILILICSECCIDEILTLRLVHPQLRVVIQEAIATIAPSVARSTFPRCHRIIARHAQAPFSLQKLKALRIEQLACILVDRHRIADQAMSGRYGIPAEEPFGDHRRDRAACGLRVFANMSKLSQEVHRGPAKYSIQSPVHLAASIIQPSRFKLQTMMQKEDMVLQRRLSYIIKAPREQMLDYKNMMTLLSSAIHTSILNQGDAHEPWPFDFGNGIDSRRAFRRGETWLTWYLLSEGPELFWQQWWNLPCDDPCTQNFIRDRAIKTFKNTPPQLVEYQRALARKLQKSVDAKAPIRGYYSIYDPFHDFANYAEVRRLREENGEPLAEEILEHVPFHINFRCPDEIVRKHEAIREGSYHSQSSQFQPR